ncbi:FAD-dependent monooxygenase [Pseudomonas sp. PWP3-1b2]|uniref:FAD-dependent monooxygenase n=1 Tax=Pseudomonas sp. PWP3-1b2 TaxID=2804656 RepID=UPI003CF3CAA4
MNTIRRVLIVGGGIGGMSAAISLSRLNLDMAIDLVDLDPDWRVYGAGITITGPTLRAFHELGILEEIMNVAYTGHGIRVCDIAGNMLNELPTPVPVGTDIPGSGGILRPVLHGILSQRTLVSGTNVRLGITVDALEERSDGAHVVFSDGTNGKYDLIIGADGIGSRMRQLIMPDCGRPFFTGQNAWRLVAKRRPQIDCRHYFLGGPVKVGLSPVSNDLMYMFLLQNAPALERIEDADLANELGKLMAPYGGIIGELREQLDDQSSIIMRPLQGLVVHAPWYRGRVLLMGDAAHPTTPQLASGAGMAVEDGVVIAQEIARGGDIPNVFSDFMERRFQRCRLVVDNSLEIGRREQAGAPISTQTELVEMTLRQLANPF